MKYIRVWEMTTSIVNFSNTGMDYYPLQSVLLQVRDGDGEGRGRGGHPATPNPRTSRQLYYRVGVGRELTSKCDPSWFRPRFICTEDLKVSAFLLTSLGVLGVTANILLIIVICFKGSFKRWRLYVPREVPGDDLWCVVAGQTGCCSTRPWWTWPGRQYSFL